MILDGDVLPLRNRDFALAPEGSFGERFEAARDHARIVGNADGRHMALMRAYDNRIRDVEEATSIRLPHPYRDGGAMGDSVDAAISAEEREAAFMARLAEIAQQHPDKGGRIKAERAISEDARELARAAEASVGEITEGRSTLRNIFDPALLAGGFIGGFEDPINQATAGVGIPFAVGRGVLMGIVRAGLGNAAINAGVTATAQPWVQSWRAEAGLPSGFKEAAHDVAWSAAFGGVVGATLEGGGRAIGAGVRAAVGKKTPTPDPSPQGGGERRGFDDAAADETIKTAKTAIQEMPADARAALRALEQQRELELTAPKNVNIDDHLDALARAERFLDDPENNAPPTAPPLAREADGPAIDDGNAGSFGRKIKIGTREAEATMVRADQLKFDAATFQYKRGGDAEGVTDKLRSVKVWDQSSAGWVYVFERADGMRVVADGHQRTGLAQRMMAGGHDPIELPAYIFREKDGWTPSEVRARAAQKNIREGTGDVTDTATVIRERPSLLDKSLPLGSAHLRQAVALAQLSDEAWGMVRAGVLPPHLAQAIGEQAATAPALHRGLAEALIRQDIATADQARLVVARALHAGAKVAETRAQMSLFGDDFFAQTLVVEQAKVLDAAMKKLRQDARLFGLLTDRGETIERKGNVLAGDANKQTEQLAKIAADLIERLSRVDGPVSDIVNAAARDVADKKLSYGKAADQVTEQVIELFQREGLNAVINREPRLPLIEEKFAEPGTPEAVEKASAALTRQEPKALEADVPPPDKVDNGANRAGAERADLFDMLPQEGRGDNLITRAERDADAAREGELADMVALCNKGGQQ